MPAGVYIPKTTTGAKLDAAKKFLAFIATPEGCDAQTKAVAADRARTWSRAATLPADVPPAVEGPAAVRRRRQGNSPALEFLSPIKGPTLEQITVEVGSGIRPAAGRAPKLYDEDVKKQAQQLGLPGW